jgi:protein-export membrane protein SecD
MTGRTRIGWQPGHSTDALTEYAAMRAPSAESSRVAPLPARVGAGRHLLLRRSPSRRCLRRPARRPTRAAGDRLPQGRHRAGGHEAAGRRAARLRQAGDRRAPGADAERQARPGYNFYYVLRDDPAIAGKDITNPSPSRTRRATRPVVSFGFKGAATGHLREGHGHARQARLRQNSFGSNDVLPALRVTLDNRLITVPYIDFTQYPTGIDASNGSEISGDFTISSAQQLANLLASGALPINLAVISSQQVSATLGHQALNQGLLAGAAGLLIVALFLILFYRVLGLIAVSALAIYAIYFYALIKLVPITLTLPGIAGLILTIGVAADANVVIFERVKEESRAGRSPANAIAAGYKRGFAAIVDANAVTFMARSSSSCSRSPTSRASPSRSASA